MLPAKCNHLVSSWTSGIKEEVLVVDSETNSPGISSEIACILGWRTGMG
jgi:hypothetical protein